jgi:hypothetical protein
MYVYICLYVLSELFTHIYTYMAESDRKDVNSY